MSHQYPQEGLVQCVIMLQKYREKANLMYFMWGKLCDSVETNHSGCISSCFHRLNNTSESGCCFGCVSREYVGLIRIICIRYGMACRIFSEIIQSWRFDTPSHLFTNPLNSPCNMEVSGAGAVKPSLCIQVSKEQLNPSEEISTQLSASSAASAWQNLPNHTGPPQMQEASLTLFS